MPYLPKLCIGVFNGISWIWDRTIKVLMPWSRPADHVRSLLLALWSHSPPLPVHHQRPVHPHVLTSMTSLVSTTPVPSPTPRIIRADVPADIASIAAAHLDPYYAGPSDAQATQTVPKASPVAASDRLGSSGVAAGASMPTATLIIAPFGAQPAKEDTVVVEDSACAKRSTNGVLTMLGLVVASTLMFV